jgi:hypothetical protein
MSLTTYDRHRFEMAHSRMSSQPSALTDDDVTMLGIVDPELARQATELRRKSLHPDPAPVPRAAQPLAAPPPPAREPMDEATADQFAEAVVALIAANIKPLVARIAALEARPLVKHCGIYQDDVLYRENSLVTRSGGMWHALRDTQDVPGTDGSGWMLVVKAGKA